MRAGVYVRISRDAEDRGLGVARQEKDCRALAERHGWQVTDIYVDNDLSAFSGKPRPSYRRLLNDLEGGDLDAIIAWHPDRLHRSPRELEDFIDTLERIGASVATVTAGDVDLATPAGRMTARIVGAVARHESEHKSARIRRKHLELAESGAISGGGTRPFGYEADRFTIREEEAAEIRRMVAAFLAGETFRGIARDLNDRGVLTSTGVPWRATVIRQLLSSGRISGQRSHHGELVSIATWPAIITPEETERLRAIIDDPARRQHRPVRTNLLTGLVHCGLCGAQMSAGGIYHPGRYQRRYICTKDVGGCNRCGIDAVGTDDHVVEAMLRFLDGDGLDLAVADARGERGLLDAIEALEERQVELAEEWAEGRLPRRAWQAARTKLDTQIADLRGQFVAGVRVAGLDVNVRDRWPTLSHDRRRAIVEALVARVTVGPFIQAVGRFDATRITIAWRS